MSRPAGALLAAIATLAVLASGCGGAPAVGVATAPASSVPNVTSPGQPSGSGHGATGRSAVAFAECMRAHDVPAFPDPDASGGVPKLSPEQLGVSAQQDEAAQSACAARLPANIASARPSPDVAQALRYATCMRAHGEPNFPDPGGDGRIPDPASVGIDQGAPAFQTANDACGADRPPYLPTNAQYNAWASSRP